MKNKAREPRVAKKDLGYKILHIEPVWFRLVVGLQYSGAAAHESKPSRDGETLKRLPAQSSLPNKACTNWLMALINLRQ